MNRSIFSIVTATIVLGMSIITPNIHAETIWYVDEDAPNDPGPGDPLVSDPDEDGTPEHPFDAIQEGIDNAAVGDTVMVLDGTYTGLGNRDIDFKGKSITVRSENGPENCIIDCEGGTDNPHCGFYFHNGEDEYSAVQGFTIMNGYFFGDIFNFMGGAVYCDNTSPTITHNIIKGSEAYAGGGIYCYDHSSPVIKNNVIRQNTAQYGGGIYCCDHSSPLIESNTISENTLESYLDISAGGGIYCAYNSSPTIKYNSISENQLPAGGCGGGISCSFNSSPSIESNTIYNNIVFSEIAYGGGICITRDCSPFITGNEIRNNTAKNGGGIGLYENTPLLSIFNNLISENIGCWGGGIYCSNASSEILCCTIGRENTGLFGGGAIYCEDSFIHIENSIIWENLFWLDEIFVNSGDAPDVVYSDVQTDGVPYPGVGNINVDPLFVVGPALGLFEQAGLIIWGEYYLSQVAAGQASDSPCVEAGNPDCMIDGTTRTDLVQDSGIIDMGYHYPRPSPFTMKDFGNSQEVIRSYSLHLSRLEEKLSD